VAAVLAISSAVRAGEADKALAAATAFQSQADSLPPYLRQQVYVAWGAALEAKQQWPDAAARYKDAAAMSGPYSGDALIGEARAREQAGETDKARELYRQAYEQYPDLPSRDLLSAKLGS
jgi:tetratricopeptide (TPR) repeat protein